MSVISTKYKFIVKSLKNKKAFNKLKNTVLDNVFRYSYWTCAMILCLVLMAIIVFIGRTGILVFKDVPITQFFFSTTWLPEEEVYGAGTFIIGTLSLTTLTLLISVPISLFITAFVAEIAPKRVKSIFRTFLDLLVGIPSVVYGYIGITVLIPFLRSVTGETMGDGILAAAIVLSLMVLPTITRISEDAISFLPREYREAAYALGSTPTQVIWKVLIPSAKSGIISAIILGMARAIGETMAVVMVIGNVAQLPTSLFTPTSVLTSNLVMQITNVQFDSTWNYALYMMAFLLLVISLVLILCVRLLRNRSVSKA